ncbi:hypothetical protein JYU34_019837 [Plutella xylostella]|uniref:protein-tyrosine-phosphatase n=1 Tax=Plutella xylostella TaxID=51655 RepID=A0ABQ7PWW5_PLUXY|nr:hypothetical protein JYU34_019837 [Plutella xylostella]
MAMGHLFRKCLVLCPVYFVFIASNYHVFGEEVQILTVSGKGAVGRGAALACSVLPENATVEWMYKQAPVKLSDRIKQKDEERALPEKDVDGNVKKFKVSNLTITNATSADAGNYSCVARVGDQAAEHLVVLDLAFPGKLVKKTDGPIRRNSTDSNNVTLQCVFEVYKSSEVKWWKRDKDEDTIDLETKVPKQLNLKHIESTYEFPIKRPEDNGTYVCQVYDSVTERNISGEVDIIVLAAPKVIIDSVKAISASQLFINWTVHAYNLPIKGYNLMYRRLPSSDYNQYTREKIGIKNTSFVMEGLDNSTEYQLKLEVTTTYGSSNPYVYPQIVKTLEKNPIFVPNISINGFSATSVTIGWAAPPEDIAEYIHYYLLEARKKDEGVPKKAYHSRDNRNLPYMFDDLEPHSTYVFRVCACSEFTQKCGNWSLELEAVTLDGTPGRPSDVSARCYEGDARSRFLNLTWAPPLKPNAEIKGYTVEVTGNATYIDRFGFQKFDTFGPIPKFVTNASRSVRFDDLKPNTNYTIKLSAMTRTRRRGEEETRHCRTAPAPPAQPPRPKWWKIIENDRFMFKMFLPRISERNGPICCYRVYMVRLPPNFDWKNLTAPKDLQVISYEEAHSVQPTFGAYMTDIFNNEKYPPEYELIMGDDKTMVVNGLCNKCTKRPRRPPPPPPPQIYTTPATTTKEDEFALFEESDTTAEPEVEGKKEKRSFRSENRHIYLLKDSGDYGKDPMMSDRLAEDLEEDAEVRDGALDSHSNYTLFVELMPGGDDDEPMYSEYLNVLMPAPSPPAPRPVNVLEIVLQITCGILALVLIAMIAFCIMHTRKARKMPPHAHVEMNPIQVALRYVVEQVLSSRGGTHTGAPPPDLPPIPRALLPAAWAERHRDTDLGFQKEFEMLPDCFPDRTTHASEARENQSKNRYPDIKAYDQTRVKLQQIDGIVGSDYINANYVMGYKERKQFICAQGPTDATVDDFWRMVWEHGLELIVMLTNLEEYSKVKCSKYWPDELRGSRAFGAITVTHVEEKRYSDYVVRELKISKQPTNSDGQPITETNGFKRNGDVKEPASGSATASPRSGRGGARRVRQYHFLMWKDFAAPEHAHSILKFINRMNEAAAALSGRPIVVHCSAGVGRTGTLVALDCLLQQLRAEDQVSVFNTVAELRRQRNFAVQSLKQYVFVYLALVEYAHFGDTEIPAARLKAAVDRLRNTPEGQDKCLMEHEFEKMLSSPIAEPLKSCAAGMGEELRAKNRSQEFLPYDRNRVILTPVPGQDFSTYINASFIEAYDNSEGFIITQDPLPNTITDFWRMVSEHSVSTIVMLSEIGEGDRKCPRYWDDNTATYDHISVQYEDTESLPYYTRRQFRVTNNKVIKDIIVKQ